jgi:anaerobic selenocysteine-containing dehydrogenase
MERRQFLKYMATFGAITTGSNWVADRVWSRMKDDRPANDLAEAGGLESWNNSICRLCPGGCGIKVRLVDGLPVKIKGNPLYPVNQGGLCPVGHAGLQMLYDPDRLQGPMRRTGSPGPSGWEPISWDEALKMIQDKLGSMKRSGNSHRLAFIDSSSRGLSKMMFKQFMNAFGSPNYIRTDDWENRKKIYRFMTGDDRIPCFDLERTRFVLSFGADLLEAESSLVWFSRHLSAMRQNQDRRRGRLIQIDPRLSITAIKADKWIPVSPGTEGAIALGIAYMLIQEGLYDKAFVEKYTFGFDDWTDEAGKKHTGFKQLVLRDYYPEKVWKITGVSMKDLVILARNFADNQPAVAICGKSVTRYPNGFYAQAAVHALNALVGNIGKPGGIINPKGLPFGDWKKPELDHTTRLSLSQPRIDAQNHNSFSSFQSIPSNLADRILANQPYPIEMMFLYKSNPAFDFPEPEKMKKALRKIPFLVSFNSFLDESSEYAHLILPDHLYLESWQSDFDLPYTYFDYFGVAQPVIEPIGNTRSTEDVILELSMSMGGNTHRSLPFKNYLSMIQLAAQRIFESKRGSIVQGNYYETWFEYLETRGWQPLREKTFERFWQNLLEQGAWMSPIRKQLHLKNAFGTPSKKFEFYMLGLKQVLEKQTQNDSQFNELKIQARGDDVYLPHYEPARFNGDEFEYPFHLIPYEINISGNGTVTNSPLLLEMIGFRQYIRWDSWAEINPETAKEIGVSEGDSIWIESPVGKLKVRAHIYPGTHPDTVSVPMGLGHTALGRITKTRGINPNTILANDFDRMSGITSKMGTRVKIYKA